jgi:signal transduction histidine kinase
MTKAPAPSSAPARNGSANEDVLRQAALFDDGAIGSLLSAIPGLLLILNHKRQIVFANDAFRALLDSPNRADMVGLPVGEVLSCHVAADSMDGCGHGDACETCGALISLLSGAEGEDSVEECVLTRINGDVARSMTLRVWTTPLRMGTEELLVMAAMDISHERRRLALEKTFFHDILNLVGSIRGFAELMELDQDVEPLEVGRRIRSAAQRVIDEIDAQRVLLSAEKGELEVDQNGLVTTDVLGGLVEVYEGQEIARSRTLKIDPSTVKVAFFCDATLLQRILGNMIKNALEASPEGEVVTLGVEQSPAGLEFWVHNRAVIPSAYRQRIFQRDFSTKGAGRGLGTYSMRLLAGLLSGEASFISEPETGTRFTLRIPV